MSTEGILEGSEDREAVRAQGRKVTGEAGEGVRTCLAAEGAGHLLLHVGHAHILLRLVVVEGDGDVVQGGKDLVGPWEAVEQVPGRLGLERGDRGLSRHALPLPGRALALPA